jgi:hypothetical protein
MQAAREGVGAREGGGALHCATVKRVSSVVAIACAAALIIVPSAFAMPVPQPPPVDEEDGDHAPSGEDPEASADGEDSAGGEDPAEGEDLAEGEAPEAAEPPAQTPVASELVERGKHAPPVVDPRTEPAPGRPRVHVEVDGRGEVKLYEVTRDDGGSGTGPEPTDRELCTAPCDVVVDGTAGQQFVVGGQGISRSLSFSLIDAQRDTTIVVKPGRRGLFIAGWTLAAIGAVAVIGGAVALTFADDDKTRRRGGGITFLSGLPLVAGGGVMIAFGRTRFRIGEAPSRRRNARP